MHLYHLLIGPDRAPSLSWSQEAFRAGVILVAGLALIRLSGLRTFSRFSPLDTIVAVVIGSNLSRALTGNAPFLGTLGASLLLVLLHRLVAQLALHSTALTWLVKGAPRVLISEGQTDPHAMQAEAISHGDLEEAIRLRGVEEVSQVRRAVLERSGDISVLKKS